MTPCCDVLWDSKQESPADARVTCATTVRVYRHLGFLKFESCTISLAILENPTLEPNSTSISKPVAKLWPFLYIQDDLETGVQGHGRSSKVALFDRAHMTLYSSSIVNMPLSVTVSEI